MLTLGMSCLKTGMNRLLRGLLGEKTDRHRLGVDIRGKLGFSG